MVAVARAVVSIISGCDLSIHAHHEEYASAV